MNHQQATQLKQKIDALKYDDLTVQVIDTTRGSVVKSSSLLLNGKQIKDLQKVAGNNPYYIGTCLNDELLDIPCFVIHGKKPPEDITTFLAREQTR